MLVHSIEPGDYLMKIRNKLLPLSFVCLMNFLVNGQETLPIYSDYLSDNVYLLHPAAAGIGDSGKIRLTSRTQWQDVENAPSLQTLSFHNRFGSASGVGLILFNNENGYHSQKGFQTTYAYHINLSSSYRTFEQLSFGLSLTLVQNQFDTSILPPSGIDPALMDIANSDGYFNGDFGASYHRGKFFSYLTIKNMFLTTKTDDVLEPIDLSKFILSAGYFFGEEKSVQFEPSVMALYEPHFGRTQVDFNCKVYKVVNGTQLWGALSYRTSFGGEELENAGYITPIIGINYQKFLFSYTYSEQLGDLGLVVRGGYHQLTLGLDVFVRKSRLAACPNINSSYFY